MDFNILKKLMGEGIGPIGGVGSDEKGKIPLDSLIGLGLKGAAGSISNGKLPIMGLMEDPKSFLPQPNKGPAQSPSAPVTEAPVSAPTVGSQTNPMSELTPDQFEKLKMLLSSQQPK